MWLSVPLIVLPKWPMFRGRSLWVQRFGGISLFYSTWWHELDLKSLGLFPKKGQIICHNFGKTLNLDGYSFLLYVRGVLFVFLDPKLIRIFFLNGPPCATANNLPSKVKRWCNTLAGSPGIYESESYNHYIEVWILF